MVHEKAGKVLRWTGLDENHADAIIGGLHKLLGEMAENPAHPLRAKAEEGLEKLAADLQFDVAMQTRVAQIRDELIDNPAMQRWIAGLWEQGRASLLLAARDPEAATAGRFGEALRQLGGTLQSEDRKSTRLNSSH